MFEQLTEKLVMTWAVTTLQLHKRFDRKRTCRKSGSRQEEINATHLEEDLKTRKDRMGL